MNPECVDDIADALSLGRPLQEQQQVCAALQETKALLEEQLAGARGRCSSLRELERDNHLLRQKIMDVEAVGGAMTCIFEFVCL